MRDATATNLQFGVFHLFCGIGGGALGFQEAKGEWRGLHGSFHTLGGVDADADACADFTALTGVSATCMDLFTREQYVGFHGAEPPANWREAIPEDLRAAASGVRPDVVFTSPPCKGFSALLPKAQADSTKYVALNRLTVRGVWLALEAWRNDPPGLVILENVPRITSRGRGLLDQIHALLRGYGYETQEGLHDVGKVGGLAQHRRRYLLVARHPDKVPAFLYRPPLRRVRAIGEVLGELPMPDDPAGGPMHRLPRLAWLTWVRLALIPPGGDWRCLQGIEPGSYAIEPVRCPHFNHVMQVTGWDGPTGAVTGGTGPMQGAPSVADPRFGDDTRLNLYRVNGWDEAAGTVTGATRPAGGGASVADPRLPGEHWRGHYRVVRWSDPARTVTGQSAAFGSNAGMAVADPRLGHEPRNGVFGVTPWDEPAGTITAAMRAAGSNVVASVADPRLPTPHGERFKGSPGLMGVQDWDRPSGAVTGAASVSGSNRPAAVADPRIPARPTRHSGDLSVRGWSDPATTVTGEDSVGSGAQSVADPRRPAGTVTGNMRPSCGTTPASVADPRLTCTPHNGAYRVVDWSEPAPTVTASGDVHAQGAAAVADPRLPANDEQGAWVIVAEDGTWHRPLTTLELAALQGFPATMRDGRPLTLVGKSQARWRERVGNAVPPPAARAVAEVMLLALLPAAVGAITLSMLGTSIWVRAWSEWVARAWRRANRWKGGLA